MYRFQSFVTIILAMHWFEHATDKKLTELHVAV